MTTGKYCADGTTIFSSAGTKLNAVYFDRIASLCLHHDDKKGHRCCAAGGDFGLFREYKFDIRVTTVRRREQIVLEA